MKSLPIIFAILLAIAWAYTSWYWYTCNIKWFCDGTNITNPVAQDSVNKDANSNIGAENTPAEKLTIDDVIVVGDTSQQVEVREVEQAPEKEVSEEETWEQSTDETTESEESIDNLDEEISEETNISLCDTPLVGPISFWAQNDTGEVEKLETFLQNTYGTDVTIDGVYDESEFELMKEFQLEYKSEVLDPWGITAPTWYVGTTSVEKINELSCE